MASMLFQGSYFTTELMLDGCVVTDAQFSRCNDQCNLSVGDFSKQLLNISAVKNPVSSNYLFFQTTQRKPISFFNLKFENMIYIYHHYTTQNNMLYGTIWYMTILAIVMLSKMSVT